MGIFLALQKQESLLDLICQIRLQKVVLHRFVCLYNQSELELLDLQVNCGTKKKAEVIIKLKIGDDEKQANLVSNDGPVDAIFCAIKKIIPHEASLELYQVQAVTQGTDAQANVVVRLKQNHKIYSANGSDTDVLVASAIAYINCLDKLKNNKE